METAEEFPPLAAEGAEVKQEAAAETAAVTEGEEIKTEAETVKEEPPSTEPTTNGMTQGLVETLCLFCRQIIEKVLRFVYMWAYSTETYPQR